jgi:hypothetical protein
MNLFDHIRHKHTEKREKHPFERELFTQISALVRWYGLDESFLKKLDHFEDDMSVKKMDFIKITTKKPVDFPLFSFSSRDEYDLTRTILRKVNNPYIWFAHCPEEILLSGILYRMNAELPAEALRCYDFETLLRVEYAKMALKNSENRSNKVGEILDTGYEREKIEDEKSPSGTFSEHIKMLHNFISKIENVASWSK